MSISRSPSCGAVWSSVAQAGAGVKVRPERIVQASAAPIRGNKDAIRQMALCPDLTRTNIGGEIMKHEEESTDRMIIFKS